MTFHACGFQNPDTAVTRTAIKLRPGSRLSTYLLLIARLHRHDFQVHSSSRVSCPTEKKTLSNRIPEQRISHLSPVVENDWKKGSSVLLSPLHGCVSEDRISKAGYPNISCYCHLNWLTVEMNLIKAMHKEHNTGCPYNIYSDDQSICISIQPRPSPPANSGTRGMAVLHQFIGMYKVNPHLKGCDRCS